jgi:hypothetical protein
MYANIKGHKYTFKKEDTRLTESSVLNVCKPISIKKSVHKIRDSLV